MSSTQIWITVGGLFAIAIANMLPWLFSKVSSGIASIGTATTKTSAVPSRREVLDDLDGAFTYFQSVGCQEGMTAIQTAVQHTYSHVAPLTPGATA